MPYRLSTLLCVAVSVGACSKPPRETGSTAAPYVAPATTEVAPHADHNPRHGGTLAMIGDNHVETMVTATGHVHFYVSDAARRPVSPTDVTGSVTIRPQGQPPQTIVLRSNADEGAMVANGPPPTTLTEYEFDLQLRGSPIHGTALIPMGGSIPAPAGATGDAQHGHAAGDHGHGTEAPIAAGGSDHTQTGDHAHGSPHGGVVASVPGGHVEAKLERSGRVTVWLLDDHEQMVPAQGASGRVRLAVAGAQDIVLSVDPAQNALSGQTAAPTANHIVGIVTITRPGRPAATARMTFHLEGGH